MRFLDLCELYTIFLAGWNIFQSDYPKGDCFICCDIDEEYDIQFKLYTSKNVYKPQYLYLNDRYGLRVSNFDKSKFLAIYIHGFAELPNDSDQSCQQIKNAFLRGGKHNNVIIVDWSRLAASPWYDYAVDNIPVVGRYVAEFIYFLLQQNYPIRNIHLIGFSLGAEVAGYTGKTLKEWGFNLPRITGLDPAWPLSDWISSHHYLSPWVAQFVNIIHTDAGEFGNPNDLGHADFYVNGGHAVQPGCLRQEISSGDWMGVISCSHQRAWVYFSESIQSNFAFKAQRCKPSTLFRRCNDLGGLAYMGMGADKRLRGKFYLTTNSRPPYGKHRVEPAPW